MKSSLPPAWRCAALGLLAGLLAWWAPVTARAAYESEMAAFAAQDLANPPPANVIVFTGSSSITGWSNLAATFPGYPVLNRGFGGSQMHDVLEKFDQVITPYHAPLYVLYEGDNDIWAGETPAAILAEYLTFVNRIDAELPGTDVILIAVKPSPSRVSRMAAMAELNGKLRDLCTARPNLRFADVFTPMLDASAQPRPELFGSDMLHMNAMGYAIWKSVLDPLLAAAPFSTDHTLLFDFGPSTEVPGPGWNVVTPEIGLNPAGVLPALVNAGGQTTTIALEIQSPFNALNEAGNTAPALFPAAATRDSLFGNTEEFGGLSNRFPRFRLNGLDPAAQYRLTFYASRLGVTDNRETLYTVTGATEATAVLNASGNVNGIASVGGISPDAANGITVSLTASPANDSPNHFTYLGVLKVDGLPPAPFDSTAPLLLSGTGKLGTVIELTFSEALDPASVSTLTAYSVNGGAVGVVAASLLSGGRVISLTLAQPVAGSVTVGVSGVQDAAGNPVAAGAQVNLQMPAAVVAGMLFDFGAAATAMETSDDPLNTWNNVTAAIGTSDTGVLATIVTTGNQPTPAGLRMIKRFNGANTNGTTASTVFPADATSDSLFGNTELFGGQSNIFPSFRLTGLAPAQGWDLSFYASRTGVSDNRETRYTVVGLNTIVTSLQVAGNLNTTAQALAVYPTAGGEITVSLSPGPANNNANHFTYLGALLVAPAPLDMLPPRLMDGRIHLEWIGTGQLQHAESPAGPWITIEPVPQPPYSELLPSAGRRFYRVRHPLP